MVTIVGSSRLIHLEREIIPKSSTLIARNQNIIPLVSIMQLLMFFAVMFLGFIPHGRFENLIISICDVEASLEILLKTGLVRIGFIHYVVELVILFAALHF